MSYERKYKEAIERMKSWVRGEHPECFTEAQKAAEFIFPELKESWDEKIKRCISDAVRKYGVEFATGTITEEKMLTWLEKQGEKANPYSGISFEYNGHTWGVCARDNGVDILLDKQLFTHLEKQGKQKDPCEDCPYPKLNCRNFPCIKKRAFNSGKSVFECIKTEHEQKSTDKVEPKFKVEKDKWYVCISQYCNCIEGRNYKASLDGRIIDDYGTEYDMHNDAYRWFRPWTIQDAKDGDVLATDDGSICVFDGTVEDGKYPFAYCGLTRYGFESYDRKLPFTHNNVCPSTKEQRNLLFQKMKEEGYEWDADKKELKKIEQKPAWSEDDEIGLDDALWCCKQAASIAKDENDMGNAWYAENWLKSIKDRVGSTLICTIKDDESTDEQKPTDKVKPKFHEDDFVVCEVTGSVYQIKNCIENLSNHKYGYVLTNGGYIGCDEVNHYHLWTIQDAKDGDVLVWNDCGDEYIFVFDKLIKDYAHAFIGFNCYLGTIETKEGANRYYQLNKLYPATKEQQDCLFKKISEAGYLWDDHAKMLICSTDMESK